MARVIRKRIAFGRINTVNAIITIAVVTGAGDA